MSTKSKAKRTFSGDFKRFFGRGLGILLPSIVTLWLLFQAFVFLFTNVAEPINRGIRSGVLAVAPRVIDESEPLPAMFAWMEVSPEQVERLRSFTQSPTAKELTEAQAIAQIRRDQLREAWRGEWYLNGVGLLVAVLLVYSAGLLLGNYVGRQVYTRVEKLISKVPGFKQVYPHVKQVVDLVFGENSTMKAFSEVVLVEYPRKGMYTIGMVTGNTFRELRDVAGGEVISVFIATSPTPMTGFVVNVRRDEAVTLDMTIEQALRWIITAGVLTPDTHLPAVALGADVAAAADAAAKAAAKAASLPPTDRPSAA